jgi:hypothetical protein
MRDEHAAWRNDGDVLTRCLGPDPVEHRFWTGDKINHRICGPCKILQRGIYEPAKGPGETNDRGRRSTEVRSDYRH